MDEEKGVTTTGAEAVELDDLSASSSSSRVSTASADIRKRDSPTPKEEEEGRGGNVASAGSTKPNMLRSIYRSFVPDPTTEGHRSQMGIAGWLRAGVLGANDALVSVSSIMVGVAANQNSTQGAILVAGLAGLVAGACSMAVGEYVSVSSQRDLEEADMRREKWELDNNWEGEMEELGQLYEQRGCEPETAKAVAMQLMAKDALQAHAIDELGIRDFSKARPLQAGIVSFLTFLCFGAIPFLSSIFIPNRWALIGVCVGVTMALLAVCGAIGAFFGGAPIWKGTLRVTVGGLIAMALTAGIGVATDYSKADQINF